MEKNCVILKWNPAISSILFYEFLFEIVQEDIEGDWSIHEYDKVKRGDEFFLLKVGGGHNGIVAHGEFISNPRAGNDWSGKGRKVYYSDFIKDFMVNPEVLPILESTALEDEIPDFDWRKGHSGVVLNPMQGKTLKLLWNKYLDQNRGEFKLRIENIQKRDYANDQIYISEELLIG